MLKQMVLSLLAVLLLLVAPGSSHTMGLGGCPRVSPIKDFDMDRVRLFSWHPEILNLYFSYSDTICTGDWMVWKISRCFSLWENGTLFRSLPHPALAWSTTSPVGLMRSWDSFRRSNISFLIRSELIISTRTPEFSISLILTTLPAWGWNFHWVRNLSFHSI